VGRSHTIPARDLFDRTVPLGSGFVDFFVFLFLFSRVMVITLRCMLSMYFQCEIARWLASLYGGLFAACGLMSFFCFLITVGEKKEDS
jgi:hypothetical protein